jgi:hypothetical protein
MLGRGAQKKMTTTWFSTSENKTHNIKKILKSATNSPCPPASRFSSCVI